MELRKEYLDIKEALKNHPQGMTVTEIAKEIKMNRHSVARYMDMLVMSGHVEMKSFGSSKVFYLSRRIPMSAILNFSLDFIVILNKNLEIINVNDRFLAFEGLRKGDILDKNIVSSSFPMKFNPQIIPGIMKALDGKESIMETRLKKGEREYFFTVRFIPTVFDDTESGVTIIFEDISMRKQAEDALRRAHDELEVKVKDRTNELKKVNAELLAEIDTRKAAEQALQESEKKFRVMVESVADGLWELDSNLAFTYISPRAYDMIGYTPREVIGKTPFELMPPDIRAQILAEARHMLTIDGEFRLLKCELLHKDGRRIRVEITGTPILDVNGVLQGYRGVTRDITMRKQES